MLLSSGFVWRYRSFETFREQCPAGDERLQRLIHERLDGALDWLEGLGAPVLARETGNPLTVGRRFEPHGVTAALVAAAGGVELGATPAEDGPLVLATGGFQGARDLVERYVAPAGRLPVRANPWSAGDGLRLGLERGAALRPPLDEFFGGRSRRWTRSRRRTSSARRSSTAVTPTSSTSPGTRSTSSPRGRSSTSSGRSPTGPGSCVVRPRRRGAGATGAREDSRDMVAVARSSAPRCAAPGVSTRWRSSSGSRSPRRLTAPPFAAVQVEAWITHTIGGLAIDEQARVLDAAGDPLPDLYAVGVDAGGVAGGGYASGLAQALVLGLVAAESVATRAA